MGEFQQKPTPIQGFKKSEFDVDPAAVLGSEVRIEDLPDGIRLYLREKSVDLATKTLICRVYRLKYDQGVKARRVYMGKFINHVPQDEDIAEQFGPGADGTDAEYIWIAKWTNAMGQETGIVTEPIIIGAESRHVHEAWLKKQAGKVADSTPAASPAASAPQTERPAPSGMEQMEMMLRIQAQAEEKTMNTFERIALIMRGQAQESPASILKDAYQGASEMIQSAVKMNLDMAKSASNKAKDDMEREGLEDDDEDEGEQQVPQGSDPIPAWLKPHIGTIGNYLENLFKGGPVGSAVKTLILSSDEWKEIFADKEKFAQSVAGMEMAFGAEKTKKALDILLNRREKPEPKTAKRKK